MPYNARVLTRWTLVHLASGPGAVGTVLIRSGVARVHAGEHRFDAQQAGAEASAVDRALRARLAGARHDDALADHGRLLFDLLLPPPVKAALREQEGALTIAHDAGDAIPWPLLHDGRGFLGTRWALGELPVGAEAPVSAPAGEGGRRLLVVADPAGDLPAARHEGEAIVSELGRAADPPPFELRLGRLPRGELQRAFGAFDLLHFAGHVDGDPAGWRLADGRLGAAEVDALAGGRAPSFVFANACGSAGAAASALRAALLRVGVRHVLGATVDLPDLPGADFAAAFYRALVSGAPVGEAVRLARVAQFEGTGDAWAAYRLFGDPCVSYFVQAEAERWHPGARTGVVLAARRLSTEDDPETLAERSSAWREGVRRNIAAHGGRLLPGRGAAQRAVFGVPVSYENDAARAAAAGLEVAGDGGVAVALESGALVAVEDDVVGPGALAAEAAVWTVPAGVFALPDVLRRLGVRAQLGGRHDEAVELLGLQSGVDASEPALVGRSAELARLEACAGQVLGESVPAAVTVVGPAGIGKSRLLNALCARLADRFNVLRGAGVPYDVSAPHAAAAGVLRALLDVRDTDGPEVVRARLEARVAAAGDDADDDFLSIDDLLDAGPRRTGWVDALGAMLGLSSRGEPGVLRVAFRTLLEDAARSAPLLVVFEDLHWLPDAGLSVVDELASQLRGVPLLLVATARPDLLERSPRWFASQGHLRIDLGPLSRAEAEAVLRQAGAGDRLEAMLRRAEGNPLFLRELAMATADELPATVEAVMRARVERQPERDQSVLRAASVMGRAFWEEAVGRLLGDDAELAETLQQLALRGFAVRDVESEIPGQRQWRFAHALLQEAVYGGLSAHARAAMHGRAALWLADEVRAAGHDLWARVAAHRATAGDSARAAVDWLQAAKRAEDARAPADARRAYEQALAQDDAAGVFDELQRGDAEEAVAELARAAGDLTAAAEALDATLTRTTKTAVAVRASRLRLRAKVDEAVVVLEATEHGRGDQVAFVGRDGRRPGGRRNGDRIDARSRCALVEGEVADGGESAWVAIEVAARRPQSETVAPRGPETLRVVSHPLALSSNWLVYGSALGSQGAPDESAPGAP